MYLADKCTFRYMAVTFGPSSYPTKVFIFSSAWLCQQSSYNRNSSVVRRPSVCGIDYLWSYCIDFFQISVVASPLGHMPRGPYAQRKMKKKSFFDFFMNIFIFVNMGPYWSPNFKTLLLPQITFDWLLVTQTTPKLRRNYLIRKKITLVLKITYKKLVLKYQDNARFPSLCLTSENAFYLCLTMSAEFMKSKFVRRLSSVRVAIISEPNARISFKFWLLLPLSHTLGRVLNFWKKNLYLIFYEYFSFSLTGDRIGAQISKNATPPTNRSLKL